MSVRNALNVLLIATLAASSISLTQAPQSQSQTESAERTSGYNQPPKNILDVMHAQELPYPEMSPTGDSILLISLQDYPSMARVSKPFLKLAGVRVEPKNHSKHDSPGGYGLTEAVSNMDLVHVSDGKQIHIALPKSGFACEPEWSADGKQFAFANVTDASVELWLGNAQTGEVHQVPGVHLNPILEHYMKWMPDQKTLLVKMVPNNIGEPPPEPTVPVGPSIQETDGQKGQSSTYETRDTLTNKHDEDLFDYYAATQLAFVNTTNSAVTPIGKQNIYDEVKPAPDGKHVLITSVHKPYSYITTYDNFPHEVEVWDLSQPSNVQVKLIASKPLADRVPIHGVQTGPRDFSWRATQAATLIWAEALDGGDWNVKVPARDKIMLSKAPFDSAATEVAKTEQRFNHIYWGEQENLALLQEYDENKHWRKTFIVDIDNQQEKPRLLWDLSSDEKYKNPGNPVMKYLPNGARVMRQDGDSIFLSGLGSSPDGDRPFLDRLDLKTLKSTRLFRCDKSSYERFLSFIGTDNKKFATWHQTPTDPPNAFIRTIGKASTAPEVEAVFSSTKVALTHVPDPTPQVRQIKKRLVKYKRADGLDLSFTLYTPPGYKEGTRLPTILYAYPLDYADSSAAGQVTGSQYRFTKLQEYQLLLLAGYAIIDRAAFPVVGDPKKAYDNYMDQLVNDAKAAVNEAVRLGVADPDRIGVTGHSHGALMTANLVAHSDLFRAGVATSGSYNKTLTAFGFQSERRSVWDAPDVYLKVSPFFSADKLKTPLLIIHGAEDANPGTTPLQARMLFQAIRGNGGTTRLVMLPHEPHWYTALESNEQLVYEMLRWFDKYVKNAPSRTSANAS
jgi:dipeptidyl aminopeptidase/acylaminoacyl peptidase